MKHKYFAFIGIIICGLVLFSAHPAFASCTNPPHPEGKIIYSSTLKVMQYCDGSDWWNMHSPGGGSGGCSFVPAGTRPEGAIMFNADNRVMQACAGNQWEALGPVGGKGASYDAAIQRSSFASGDIAAGDHFGWSAALNGSLALISSDADNTRTGGAYLFDVSDPANPVQRSKLTASDGTTFADFATDLVMSPERNLALVGAFNGPSPPGNGSVYLYDISDPANPVERSIITASDAAAGENFSFVSFASSGELAVIGATMDNSVGPGKAYVFDISDPINPIERAIITPSDGADQDWFGHYLEASEHVALIPALLDDTVAGSNAGSVYVFDISDPANPVEKSKIEPADAAADDLFGTRVAMYSTLALIGAYRDDTAAGADAGSAYLYDVSDPANPVQLAKIEPDDAAATDRFGFDVHLTNKLAFIGAYWADTPTGVDTGAVYVFDISDRSNPAQIAKIIPNTGSADHRFGYSIGSSGDVVLVTAILSDVNGADAGQAFLFEATYPGNCVNPNKPEATLEYNWDYRVYQYCDGANWVPVGKALTTLRDDTPDAFGFTDQTDVALSTPTESNIVQITGLTPDASVSISGAGSPEYRICTNGTSDANCDASEVQTWTTGAGTINNNEYLQLRLTSNAANSTMNSATVTVGTANDQWDVTTLAAEKTVFVSSTAVNLYGGISGADAHCNTLAGIAGLSGTYKAWMSDSTTSPSTSFAQANVPYKLVNGTQIADDWTDLTDGTIDNVFDRDENGNAVGVLSIYTSTDQDGTGYPGRDHCNDWTTGGSTERGLTNSAGSNWTWTTMTDICSPPPTWNNQVYCFQQ